MPQPSVSQHIQSLEKYFGEQLFCRSGRNIELTEAGLTLMPLAREAAALSTRIEEAMASQKGVAAVRVAGLNLERDILCASCPASSYCCPKSIFGIHPSWTHKCSSSGKNVHRLIGTKR